MGIINVIEGGRVYLDANIFIYALEGYPEFAAELAEIFAMIDNGGLQAVTSELTLAETLVKPIMDGNAALEQTYKEIIQSGGGLGVEPINRNILIEAAHLRAKNVQLRLPDAIHAVTATASGCRTFLTNDRRLKTVTGLEVVVLSEVV